ncbi:MAG: DNA repair protein RadA [Clostridiales bacterium]|nr:DNA repair protein RadA [Clostridiales bacterium]
MKEKTVFACGECGYEAPRWLGQCPQCGSWNTLVEQEKLTPQKNRPTAQRPIRLEDITVSGEKRRVTGIAELDRVLGGGLVGGMVVLLAGDPGIGKSTLLLQTAHALSGKGKVLYVSGEESGRQLKLRADRLGIPGGLLTLCDTNAENAMQEARAAKADTLIIDSIQTMQSEESASAAGSVTQVRTCTAQLTRFAKETGTVVWIVGHVTKDGAIAGPRVLEHIVDTVLYFEGDRHEGLRLLRAVKNRFGATNELGVFEMREDGMAGLSEPSSLFLSGHASVGCAVTCVLEGTRPLLAEVQSLLGPTAFGSPRRAALGLDTGRLNLLLAVLERKAGLTFHDKDVYCNVAGNLRVTDRGADLACALCLASAMLDRPLPEQTAAIGEVGLTGELRPVSQMETRIKECARLGFAHIVVPKGTKTQVSGVDLLCAFDLRKAIQLLDLR